MSRKVWLGTIRLFALSVCVLLAGCSGDPFHAHVAAEKFNVAPAVAVETAASSTNPLERAFDEIIRTVPGRIGVAATVLETGESVAVNGNERFPMQSVYKVPIGMTVLHNVDQGKLTLQQRVQVRKSDFVSRQQHSPVRDQYPKGTRITVAELLRLMISESDGTACDVLLRLVGGPKAVADYLREINVKDVIVLSTEKQIGQDNAEQYRNWSSPLGATLLLRAVHEGRGLSPQNQKLLLKLMTDTPTGLNRLKGQLPKDTLVAHKTGSSNTIKGMTAATNDIGIIRLPNGKHLAIAVFVSDSSADQATREGAIARIALAAWNYWNK